MIEGSTVRKALDPITIEVISSGLSTIVEEMGTALVRAAFSTNIRERQDCSTAIFDEKGRTIAQAERIPIHLGSLLGIVDYVLKNCDLSDLQPGDVFIGNDAYTGGGTHLNDIVFMEPVFVDGLLVAWVSNLAHHSDFVDRGHQHIFQEGLRIPPVRLYRGGVLQKDMLDLVLLNCQVPHERVNDFRAQMAANALGVRRFQDMCARYGETVVLQGCDEILDYTERKTRAGIARIPSGKYAFSAPFDTNLVEGVLDLHVAIEVRGDEMFFDFAGNPAQMRAEVNMVYTALLATVYFAVKTLVGTDILPNSGFYRPIHVSAPEGSVVNALPPGAVYSRTDIAQRLGEMILAALVPAIPDEVMAAGTGGALMTTSGIHPRTGRFYVYNDGMGGGMGARAGKDGLDAIQVHLTNSANLPVEALETEHPIRVEAYELVRDSGGPGRFRGGMTMRRTSRVLDHDATLWAGGINSIVPPYGLAGGLPGNTARVELSEGADPMVKRSGRLRAGETVTVSGASGGGYGDPRLRDRSLVLKDLREERISREAAIGIYGLDPSEIG